MRSQQEAERAEQQRIKSLVLNYDLTHNSSADDGAHDSNGMLPSPTDTFPSHFHYVLQPSRNGRGPRSQLMGSGQLNNPADFDYADLKRMSRRNPRRLRH